jgi:hypothetical protein
MTTRGPGLTKVLHFTSAYPSSRLLTQPGSGRSTVISGRDGCTKINTPQSGTTGYAGDTQPRQDEELHLLASRRKLLALNDWPALDHTRPLRIGFPTAGDKDRVGRRRKTKKPPETRTKAARPRFMTPLFEERLEHYAHHMSGYLSPEHDDIEVRVGTSAFGTQSRPSRRSNTSRNASMGAHSTALSHLSEESMLLGADGDSFDADQVEVPAYTLGVHDALEGSAQPTSSDSGQYEPEEVDRHSRPERGYSPASDVDPELQQYGAESFDENNQSISSPYYVPEPRIVISPMASYAAPKPRTWSAGDLQQDDDLENVDLNVPVDPPGMAIPPYEDSPKFDAEQEWRHLMGVVTQSESFTSRKALGSSSEHITTSESMQRVIPGDNQHGAGVNGAITDPKQLIGTLDQAHLTQAPDMLMAGTSPPQPLNNAEDNTDNEALWREFIIGSQDSESGDELHSAWQRTRAQHRQSSEQPRSVQLSGLGTSDQATRGEATIYSPSALTPQVANLDEPFEDGTESIEEFPIDDSPRLTSPRTIHATSAKRLDPRRFRMPMDSEGNTTRRESQQHAVSRRHSSRRFKANEGRG